jgi:hypothetical protein
MTVRHRGIEPHPSFTKAPRAHQWTGTVEGLWEMLNSSSLANRDRRPESWNWWVLSSGVFVSMRQPGRGREVRISREIAPRSQQARDAWATEVESLARQFGVADWSRSAEEIDTAVAVVLVEPVVRAACACGAPVDDTARLFGAGEMCSACTLTANRPAGLVPCPGGCGAFVKPDPVYDPNYCNGCAFEYGRRHTAELAAARQGR